MTINGIHFQTLPEFAHLWWNLLCLQLSMWQTWALGGVSALIGISLGFLGVEKESLLRTLVQQVLTVFGWYYTCQFIIFLATTGGSN